MQNKFFNYKNFKESGVNMIDMINDLHSNLNSVPVQPKVKPGFLRQQFNAEPPIKGEDMNDILKETREKIFPGMTQWQHPGFFAYYPSGVCHAAVLADMFSTTFNSPAFIFNASPSHTEVENIVVDWLAQLFDLPEHFQLKNSGGGSLQISISDAMFNTVHAAKRRKMKELGITNTDPRILKFVGYYSKHSFQACEKSLMLKDIGHVRVVPIYFDEKVQNFQPDLVKFKEMLEKDVAEGLIPFWANFTQGTTPSCAYEPIEQIHEVLKPYNVWLNIDAAYAGVSWICEEFRSQVKGLELVDSLMINCAKFMLVGLNGAVLFIKDKMLFQEQFSMQPMEVYKNQFSGQADCVDYSNWQVGFGRRFNSLKLFYVIKYLGKEGLQQHVREKVVMAQQLVKLIESSQNFEIFTKPEVGLVTFRYIGQKDQKLPNEELNLKNRKLKEIIDQDTSVGYISPSELNNIYFLRLCVSNDNTSFEIIEQYWKYIEQCASQIE